MSNDKAFAELELDLIIFGQCSWVETIDEDGELKIERIAPEDIVVSKKHIKEDK